METKKKYNKIEPQQVEPIVIPAGKYLTLSDYARSEGITRMTAYLRAKRGGIITIMVGRVRLVLVEDLS